MQPGARGLAQGEARAELRQTIVALMNNLVARTHNYKNILSFTEDQLRQKMQNLVQIENERVRLEAQLLDKAYQNRVAIARVPEECAATLGQIEEYFYEQLRFQPFRNEKSIVKLLSETRRTKTREDQFAFLFLFTNLQQHCIMYLMQLYTTKYMIQVDDTSPTLDLKRFTVAVHKIKDKQVPLMEKQVEVATRSRNSACQCHLHRCVWRPEELHPRVTEYKEFMIKFGSKALASEQIAQQKHWDNIRRASECKLQRGRPPRPAQRGQGVRTENQHYVQMIARQHDRIRVDEERCRLVNTARQAGSTVRQARRPATRPEPPGVESLTSYIDIQGPLQLSPPPGLCAREDLQNKYILYEDSYLRCITEISSFANATKTTADSGTAIFSGARPGQNSSQESLSQQEARGGQHVTGIERGAPSSTQVQIVQKAIPTDIIQALHSQLFNVTRNHWVELQNGEPSDMLVGCYRSILQREIEKTIQIQKSKSSKELARLDEWGEQVLHMAANQQLPNTYVPILTPCARHVQYYNMDTGEVCGMHPEVVKAQQVISAQYYLLEDRVRLSPNSAVLQALRPLEVLAGWRAFFVARRNEVGVLRGVGQDIAQSAAQATACIGRWIQWG